MRAQIGKCTNYSGCKLAYRNERITVLTKGFNCPECGSPLERLHRAPRSEGTWVLAILVGLVLLVAIGAVIWLQISIRNRHAYVPPEPTPPPATITVPVSTPTPSPTPAPTPRPTPPPTPEPTPTPRLLGFNLTGDQLAIIKREVIRRIELMPTVTEKQKNFLYASLARSQGMKLLATVSFATGQKGVSPVDLADIRSALNAPGVSQTLKDPTLVFVVLGYASKTGNDQKNLSLSQMRADTVMNTLQQDLQIQNVIYPVPMGASELFGNGNPAQNQVAEIWIVLP